MFSSGYNKIAVFGGVYNNHIALESAIVDAKNRCVDEVFCLGDLGAFGPNPDKVFPILKDNNVKVLRGNYDDSIANELKDCQCGYTDPRDNYFAKISYNYTFAKTSLENRRWMKELPWEFRLKIGNRRVLMCHGSPRKINEFLWESTTPTHFIEKLLDDYDAEVILATHTGIHWKREVSKDRCFVNVGVLGRPENDGSTNAWYTVLTACNGSLDVQFVPLDYDYESLALEMKREKIPEEFIDTIRSGWWTTCLEILPSKERRRGKF